MYDIKSIIGRKQIYQEVKGSIERTGSPKKDANIAEHLDEAGKEVF